MTWIDWLTVAFLLLGVLQGVLRGWQSALLGALVAVLAFIGAAALLPLYAEGVASLPLEAAWARTIAFGIVLLGLYTILSLVANAVVGTARRPRVEGQLAGALLGLVRGAAVALVVVGVLAATPRGEALTRDIRASRLGAPLLQAQRQLMRAVHQAIPAIPPIGPDRRL